MPAAQGDSNRELCQTERLAKDRKALRKVDEHAVIRDGSESDTAMKPTDSQLYEQLELPWDSGPVDPDPGSGYEETAERGDPKDQFILAQDYEFGAGGVPRDQVEALVWYKAAQANGHVPANRKVAKLLEALAKTPSVLGRAEYRIGSMFRESTRVQPDQREAITWFKRAAKRGHAGAQFELGQLFEQESDFVAAYAWYNTSAKQGDKEAKSRLRGIEERLSGAELDQARLTLGQMYRSGTEVPDDETEALFWYRGLAKKGVPEAVFVMGEIYHYGEGVPINVRAAIRWYRRAAENGNLEATLVLGDIYLIGDGVPKDRVEGLAWLYLASRLGSRDAEACSQHKERSMTPSEVSQAKQRSNELVDGKSQADSRESRTLRGESERGDSPRPT